MKKYIYLIFILSLVFFFMGCSEGNISNDVDNEFTSNGLAKVIINPEEINVDNKAAKTQNLDSDNDVTHIGTRIEYPGETAYFIQSVEIDYANNSGIITFDIPATEDANIYVVAVKYSDEQGESRARYFGIKTGINIKTDTVTEIRTNDFSWVQADWRYGELDDQILVKDPFMQIDKKYDEYFIEIKGISTISDDFTDDGYRIFYEAIGEPYLRHSFFNLPINSRYLIDQIQ